MASYSFVKMLVRLNRRGVRLTNRAKNKIRNEIKLKDIKDAEFRRVVKGMTKGAS